MTKILLLALVGCSSIVSDPCAAGFSFHNGACDVSSVTPPDGGVGGGGGDGGDGMPGSGSGTDAAVCTADTTSDPFNCGACGVRCPSGICIDSACAGDVSGHIVGIGHDFLKADAAMERVLGDAVALGRHADVAVASWHGSAATGSIIGTGVALDHSFSIMSRSWHEVTLPETPDLSGVDVLLVDAQRGSGDDAAASAVPWKSAVDDFLATGGVVVVLEGKSGVSYRWAQGAGVFDVSAPVDATGTVATVIAPADATTQAVLSPYLAMQTSIAYPTADGATITTDAGVLAFHLTR